MNNIEIKPQLQPAKLREDVSIEPRWSTTMSGTECRHLLRDATTGWYMWLSDIEAAFAMALRYVQSPTAERIGRYLLMRHGITIDSDELCQLTESFSRYGLLKSSYSVEDIRVAQQAERRRVYFEEQVRSFRSVLEWVGQESPFYSEAIREHCGGVVPEISTLDDIAKLPRLSKTQFRTEMIRLHPEVLAKNRDAFPTSWATSSGTSGNRVQTLTDPQRQKRFVSDCTWQFVADKIPTAVTTKSCVLTTPVCSGTECHMDINRPIEERLISDGRRLILNSFTSPVVASTKSLEAIDLEIEEFKPNVLRGAGSYLAAYANYLVRTKKRRPRFDFIVLGWELNSRIHTRLLEKVFECRVIDEWGATEMMPIASQCEYGSYHVANEHHIEIVRGGRKAQPGEVGQILVTSLRRHATPLIRYEIGDLARASNGCCPCGEPSQTFASIEGRARDAVFSASGEPITAREIDNIVSGEIPRDGIDYYSLVQTSQNTYKLNYVASDCNPQTLESALHKDLLERLSGSKSAELKIERTKEIFPSNSGKFRLSYQESPSIEFQW